MACHPKPIDELHHFFKRVIAPPNRGDVMWILIVGNYIGIFV